MKRVAINANNYRTAGPQFGDDNEFKAFLRSITSPTTMLLMVDSYADVCFSPGNSDLHNAMVDGLSSVVSKTVMESHDIFEAYEALKKVEMQIEAEVWWHQYALGPFPEKESDFIRGAYSTLIERALKLIAVPAQEFSEEET